MDERLGLVALFLGYIFKVFPKVPCLELGPRNESRKIGEVARECRYREIGVTIGEDELDPEASSSRSDETMITISSFARCVIPL